MAIATPESYADMIDRAKAGGYAIPAINVTSSQTLSAALQGFTEAESDGIVQVSNGGAAYWSGSSRADRVKGSLAMSAYAYTIADLYPITFALHTDHCPRKLVDTWLRPLLEIEIEQAKRGEPTAFQSHMWDGSAETLDDNIKLAVELLAMSKKANTILEIEIGAVGGEEDGIKGEENASLYTTAADVLGRPHRLRGTVVHGRRRGRELGFPTANLEAATAGVVPPDGVYAGWLVRHRRAGGEAGEEHLPAAISIGTNPTFDDVPRRTVEAHVLGRADLDLYGEEIGVELVERLRPMLAFDGLEPLLAQMRDDVARTARILNVPVPGPIRPEDVTA